MPLTDEIKAKDALIRKQRDVIAKYLILDIEDFLAEAREKAEAEAAEAEAAEAYELALAEEKARGKVCWAPLGSSLKTRRSPFALRLSKTYFGSFVNSNMADSLHCTVDEVENDLQTTIRRHLSRKHHLLQLP
jgi:hypothetical protein